MHNLWHNNKIKVRLFNPGTIIYGTIIYYLHSFRPKINYGTIIVIIIRTVCMHRKLGPFKLHETYEQFICKQNLPSWYFLQ